MTLLASDKIRLRKQPTQESLKLALHAQRRSFDARVAIRATDARIKVYYVNMLSLAPENPPTSPKFSTMAIGVAKPHQELKTQLKPVKAYLLTDIKAQSGPD